MAEPILVIDPGHGGKDLGGGSNDYFKEKDMNLKISLYQYNRLRELGVPVDITRKSDVYLSPSVRTQIVRDSGAKYCISNHINAASAQATGAEAIYSIYSDGKLAKAIYQEIVNAGMKGRRTFTRASTINSNLDFYFMHRETGAVDTIIVEYGFATNPNDTRKIINHWKDYAEAVVKAYCEFIGHKYQEPQVSNNDSTANTLPVITEKVKVKFEDKELTAYLTNENHTVMWIREIANLLDLEVEWENSTNTVLLKRKK